jgi:TorA maturation chaperone TorD
MYFNGDCMIETRKWYSSTVSEGAVRWMYAASADIDYASLFMEESAASVPPWWTSTCRDPIP